jgi:hypothetical protein
MLQTMGKTNKEEEEDLKHRESKMTELQGRGGQKNGDDSSVNGLVWIIFMSISCQSSIEREYF